jgi:hypothetical protein
MSSVGKGDFDLEGGGGVTDFLLTLHKNKCTPHLFCKSRSVWSSVD